MKCPRCQYGFVLLGTPEDAACINCSWSPWAPTREPTAAERAEAERPNKRGPVKQGMAL